MRGGLFLKISAKHLIRSNLVFLWVIFTSEFSVWKGSAVDDLKWQSLVGWWAFLSHFAVAEPGVFIPDTVEEVDRLQLHHPSWLLYESAVMNLIGGGQAFSAPPQGTSSKRAAYVDKRPWLHPQMLERCRCGRHHRSRGYKWLTVLSGANSCTVQWHLFLELLHCITDVRRKGNVSDSSPVFLLTDLLSKKCSTVML